MSHDTHGSHNTEKKTTTSFRSAFWLIIILAGLFIAAVNFVRIMGSESEEGHGTEHATEATTHEGHEQAAETHTGAADSAHAAHY